MQILLITMDMHLRTEINKILALQVTICRTKEHLIKLKDDCCTVIIDDKFPNNYEITCFLMSNYPEAKIIYLVSKNMINRPLISQGNLYFIQRPISSSLIKLINEQEKTKSNYNQEFIDNLIIGNSEAIIKIKRLIKSLANNDFNVFIYGETGTGKDLIARAIHQARYPNYEMITESCSFLNGTLTETTLFGHNKGSFTGAIEERTGLIAKANGSTLFLDEVEELSVEGQAKLLRLLESGEYRKLGDNNLNYSHFSLITATNIHSDYLLTSKMLRKDFFHRISTITITIPPLKDRIEDIPALTYYYEKKRGYKNFIRIFDNLFVYSWPGNIRELFAVIDRIHCIDPYNLLPTKSIIENKNY